MYILCIHTMKTIITVKSDKLIKECAQKIAKNLGLSLSDVVNASLRNFIHTREINFKAIPRMTPKLERIVARVEKDIRDHKNVSPALATSEELISYLDAL